MLTNQLTTSRRRPLSRINRHLTTPFATARKWQIQAARNYSTGSSSITQPKQLSPTKWAPWTTSLVLAKYHPRQLFQSPPNDKAQQKCQIQVTLRVLLMSFLIVDPRTSRLRKTLAQPRLKSTNRECRRLLTEIRCRLAHSNNLILVTKLDKQLATATQFLTNHLLWTILHQEQLRRKETPSQLRTNFRVRLPSAVSLLSSKIWADPFRVPLEVFRKPRPFQELVIHLER
jgi:hypothetical protein